MFILMLYTSSFIFQPKSLTITAFETKVACEQALIEAKREWVTTDGESKCVDLAMEVEIRNKETELRKLRSK